MFNLNSVYPIKNVKPFSNRSFYCKTNNSPEFPLFSWTMEDRFFAPLPFFIGHG